MTIDERLTAAHQRLARAEVRHHLSEAELFEAHGLPMVEALARLRLVPRRRCPCGQHGEEAR